MNTALCVFTARTIAIGPPLGIKSEWIQLLARRSSRTNLTRACREYFAVADLPAQRSATQNNSAAVHRFKIPGNCVALIDYNPFWSNCFLQLSSFTDLDSTPNDLTSKWEAAKNALVILMRSWAGVVLISSDEMGLPRLVQMLRDPKVRL